MHPNGKPYRWLHRQAQILVVETLQGLGLGIKQRQELPTGALPPVLAIADEKLIQQILAMALQRASNGSRNHTGFLAGSATARQRRGLRASQAGAVRLPGGGHQPRRSPLQAWRSLGQPPQRLQQPAPPAVAGISQVDNPTLGVEPRPHPQRRQVSQPGGSLWCLFQPPRLAVTASCMCPACCLGQGYVDELVEAYPVVFCSLYQLAVQAPRKPNAESATISPHR